MKIENDLAILPSHDTISTCFILSHQLNPCSKLLKGTGLVEFSLTIYSTLSRIY